MLQNDKQFYLVGIGASAGGLEAIEAFFSNIPVNTGLAFVIIQHLSPDYKSLMPEILSKRTPMKVLTAEDGMLVEPNHIYLIPRKKFLKVYQSKLYLTDKDSTIVLNLPIDIFFNSLADDFGEKAIGIILSGTGSDGSRGIRAIKEEGGLILVQNLESSKFDGMPRSAISTGVVDFILPPEEMGEKLINFIQHPYTSKEKSKEIFKDEEDYLTKTIILLKEKFGLDFAFYKNSTIVRRLERRLSINQIDNLRDYYEYLFTSTNEQKVLYKELLIGVTRFFRDTEAFEVLENEVIPKIFEAKTKKEEVRIWIAGCSTGEEAYSVAIAIKEYMNKHSYYNDVKIFATDVDKSAIEYASSGIYSASITADVTRERLEKFFSQIGDSYKINNIIREMIVFATHNLINDPPFNKLDLITCRNLLIYFQPALQQKVMNLFHFSLNSEGFLFLGSSESINELHHLFEIYNHKWRFYKCQEGKKSLKNLDSNLSSSIKITRKDSRKNLSLADKKDELLHLYTQKLLADHVPETIMVNENLEVVNVYGNVNLYLNFPSGRSLSNRLELNISNMVPENLRLSFNIAINNVLRNKKEVTHNNIKIKSHNNEIHIVDLIFSPLIDEEQGLNLVLIYFLKKRSISFSEVKELEFENLDKQAAQRISDLENELKHVKENLQASIEELETTNEELQSTNEELISANEELQSTNEELQSVNEELNTVNTEFQVKNHELTQLNYDMENLLRASELKLIFLDKDLNIKKYTNFVYNIINIKDNDIGRPISDLTHKLDGVNLVEILEEVIYSGKTIKREVTDNKNHYLMNILPYKITGNYIDGAVIIFNDITEYLHNSIELQQEKERFELAETAGELGAWDWDLISGKLSWSKNVYAIFEIALSESLTYSNFLSMIYEGDREKVNKLVELALSDTGFYDVEHRIVNGQGKIKWVRERGKVIFDEEKKPIRMTGIVYDIDKLKVTQEEKSMETETLHSYINMYEGIFVVLNSQGEITLINNKGSELLGDTIEKLIGLNWFENFLPNEMKDTVFQQFQSIMEAKNMPEINSTYVNEIVDKNGKRISISWINNILKLKDEVVGTLSWGRALS